MPDVDAYQFILNAPASVDPDAIYSVARNMADGTTWNGLAFEAYNADNVATYALPLVSLGGGMSRLRVLFTTFPAGANYVFRFHQRVAETPASTDFVLATAYRLRWALPAGEGAGDIVVTHNTGGTDALRCIAGGGGVEADVTAYLTIEFAAGAMPRGATRTGSDGRWLAPMKLFAGGYTFAFDAPGHLLGTVSVEVA